MAGEARRPATRFSSAIQLFVRQWSGKKKTNRLARTAMATQFQIKSADGARVASIQSEFGLPHFIAQTMVAHGISTLEQARMFLSPDLERDWNNPYCIPGLDEAANRIERAIRAHERILVFGDFDLDGISATTVLTRGLRALGAEVDAFIPKRFEEGYGLSAAAIERAAQRNPQLVITVDCGISCKGEVPLVHAAGMDLVVTDHHEPGEALPEGIPVADPKLDPDCPSAILAGVGVALKMVQALGARFGQPNLWREYTDFATLGTVADLMPLTGENRALVADGVARMNANPRPCIAALIGVCKQADKAVTSTNLSFSLIPRLNAAGRMGNADLALDLLMADSFDEASKLASRLETVNDERRRIESELAAVAKEQAAEVYHGQRALVVWGEGWHEGVKGIVASRLVNTYGVPALLFTIDGDEARGSGRSVGQVNLFKAVESCSDILTRFGGHEAAVGVTLPVSKLEEFTQRLCAYMDELDEDSFHPLLEIDACVNLGELTLDSVAALDALAPFGQENPLPRYLARNVRLTNCRAVGADKNHLSCSLTDGVATVDGIMFHCETLPELLRCGSVVDAAFEVQIDEWRGRRNVKCMLQAIEPAATCPAMQACLPQTDVAFVNGLCDNESPCCGACCAHVHDDTTLRREAWRKRAQAGPETLEAALVEALIGSGSLHGSQRRALDELARGRNVLAVMGTGRGKSLIFQIHAAKTALMEGKASLFVYPLRALISDQQFHIMQAFEHFGLQVRSVTGQSTPLQRQAVRDGLAQGSVDVVLTTPEYLAFHPEDFTQSQRIGFVVVDEAHHMAEMGAGKRSAYSMIGEIASRMGYPTVLACTATAPDRVLEGIRAGLGIDEFVFDPSSRPNLRIDDRRGLRDKDSYLASIVATGEKTLIYVNSRLGSMDLTRRLRSMVPQMAMQIGFYNAALTRDERVRIEQLFRQGVLQVLVCTSAFGEGVNIPGIRHVVLYHMPFSEVEFNQISGRAGRDGEPAWIHLLFGRQDASVNEGLLRGFAPSHDTMAQIYRELRGMQRQAERDDFSISDDDLAERCSRRIPGFKVDARMCESGMAVFRELGLVQTRIAADGRSVHVCEVSGKVELTDSVRYREGLGEVDTFMRFRDWVMSTAADDLRECLIRPILPEDAAAGGLARPSGFERGGGHDR